MTEQNTRRTRRLSVEIIGLLGVCIVVSLFWFQLLSGCAFLIADGYFQSRGMVLNEAQLIKLDDWIFNLSLLVTVGFFLVLFLFLLGERLSYIREILRGIHALRSGQDDYVVPLEGSNELTQLAEAVNYLSATQRHVKEKERLLSEEKDQLIRALSHDIRTPLTSIMSYSELLISQTETESAAAKEKQKEQLELIRRKAEQIKELTDILLEGGRRNLEQFDDARLLMEQLAAEFQDTLEETHTITVDLSRCGSFSGRFDVQELRRIFDNLISNIQKYANPQQTVSLTIAAEPAGLVIRQTNHILPGEGEPEGQPREGYRIGLNSIRRIAHNYGGSVNVRQDGELFTITVTLSEF